MSDEPIPFTPYHAGRIAETLRDRLDHDLDTVARNRGQITYGHGSVWIENLSDQAVEAYGDGLANAACNIADWLESSWDDEGMANAAKAKGASCRSIRAAMRGAVGECLQRRHPGKSYFAGRLRKFNSALIAIRSTRVKLEDMPYDSQEAADLGYQFLMGEGQKLSLWFIRLDYQPKDPEQLAALERCRDEMTSLEVVVRKIRDFASRRRLREIEEKYNGKAA